jgi:hypothetical protein
MTDSFVPQNGRRIVTLDIETISLDPNDPRGALGAGSDDAAPGAKSQIIIAGMLIDDGEKLTAAPAIDREEPRLLEKFWRTLRPEDTLWGFNLRDFDLQRIMQRSWILGVRPTVNFNMAKYRETNVVDWMERWTNWGQNKGCKLDNIARALGVGHKSGDSGELEAMWRAGQFKEVLDHCMEHVYLTYLIGCRMSYRDPLPFNLPKPSPAAAEAIPFQVPQRQPVAVPVTSRLPLQDPAPSPLYVNQDTAGRYRYVADGQGGMRPLTPEVEPAPAARPVRGFAAAMPQPTAPVAQTTQSSRPPRKKSNRVVFAENGGRLVLTGGTFALQEGLKALGGVRSKQGETWIWEVAAEKFDALAGLCARSGMTLVAAQATAA